MFLTLLAVLVLCEAEPGRASNSIEKGEQSSLCPDHWIDATLSGLGCLYFNSSAQVDWLDAAELCQHPDNNASLVEIWSELQLDFVRSELIFLAENGVDTDWWTGATDLGREGHWYWAGSLATVGDFLWYKPTNQPNGGIAHNCMFLENGGSYEFYGNDYGCTKYPRVFICQKK